MRRNAPTGPPAPASPSHCHLSLLQQPIAPLTIHCVQLSCRLSNTSNCKQTWATKVIFISLYKFWIFLFFFYFSHFFQNRTVDRNQKWRERTNLDYVERLEAKFQQDLLKGFGEGIYILKMGNTAACLRLWKVYTFARWRHQSIDEHQQRVCCIV